MRIDESFSQFKEDVLIASVLHGSGLSYTPYFVDIGANDGKSWSNSWLFGQQDWGLLLVEPIPKFADNCRMLYDGNAKVIVEEAAISANVGSVDFFVTDEPARDLLQMGSSLSKAGVPFGLSSTKITVQTMPLHALLAAHDVPKDYAVLSVDAEGHDLAVLETAALQEWKPRLVCVEMIYGDPKYADIDSFLTSSGYRYAISTPANGLYIRTF